MPIDLSEVAEWMELPELEPEISGEPRVYDGQTKGLSADQLERLTTLLPMVWSEGDRHALALTVAGTLCKAGYSVQAAEGLISTVCRKAGDSEVGDRLQCVRDTYQAASLGQPVRAWRDLSARLPQDTLEFYRDTLGVRPVAEATRGSPEERREEAISDPYRRIFRLTKRLALPSFPMLIDDWLPADPRGAVGYLAGRSQSFKSFLALDWAAHISQGMPWNGFPVEQGQALYVCGEGQYDDLMGRLRAWEKQHDTDAEHLYVRLSPINLMQPEDVAEAIALIDLERDVTPRLVVMDTLSQCSNGMDENSSHDAKIVYHASKEFGTKFGATVLVVHHTGRADGSIMRGSSALFDDADFVHSLVRPGWEVNGMQATLNAMKMKGRRLIKNFELQAVPVKWEDESKRGEDLVLLPRVYRSKFDNIVSME